jgi:predicted dehydrogenase
MTKRYGLGVIGADERTEALVERIGAGSTFAHGWFELVAGGSDAVFVGGQLDGRAAAVVSALAAGKHVLCPLPVGLTAAELDAIERARRDGGGLLLAPTDLSETMAGRQGLDLVAAGELGALHAIFLAVQGSDSLAAQQCEAFDYLLSCTGGALPERLYAAAATDALLLTLRFPGDLIATVELNQSLPAGAPREVEIDLTGQAAALRIEPYKVAISVNGERRLWHPHPVVAMLERFRGAIERGQAGEDAVARSRKLLTLMEAVRQSLGAGDAVVL